MARSLITGGGGFVGSHLAEHLLAMGDEVAVIDDFSTGRLRNIERLRQHPRFRFILGSVANETVMDPLASECDIIYHFAAAVGVEMIVQSPLRTIETNIMGATTVLRVAERYRRKVVLASSSEIYGKSNKIPFAEDDDRLLGPTTRSRWGYAESKALLELLALAYWRERGLPVVIVRLFNAIGPRQTGRYGMVVPRFVSQALDGCPLTVCGDGSQSRCFVDVRDVVRGVRQLAVCPEAQGQAFNLGSTREITIAELAQLVISITGSRSEITHSPYEEAYETGFEDISRRVPDVSKANRFVGWSADITLEETLRAVTAHIVSERNGWGDAGSEPSPPKGPGYRHHVDSAARRLP